MSSSGAPQLVVRQPLVLHLTGQPAQVPPTSPLQSLTVEPSSLSPSQPARQPHLTEGMNQANFQKIQAYATDAKQEIGFFGWKFFRAKRLAKEYLIGHGIDLKQVLPKMPWNASRSLCVLCMLVEKGLRAEEVHQLFDQKEQIERGDFEVQLGEGLTRENLVPLAQCQTPTFLKKVADKAVSAHPPQPQPLAGDVVEESSSALSSQPQPQPSAGDVVEEPLPSQPQPPEAELKEMEGLSVGAKNEINFAIKTKTFLEKYSLGADQPPEVALRYCKILAEIMRRYPYEQAVVRFMELPLEKYVRGDNQELKKLLPEMARSAADRAYNCNSALYDNVRDRITRLQLYNPPY